MRRLYYNTQFRHRKSYLCPKPPGRKLCVAVIGCVTWRFAMFPKSCWTKDWTYGNVMGKNNTNYINIKVLTCHTTRILSSGENLQPLDKLINLPKPSTFPWFLGQLQLYLAQLQIPKKENIFNNLKHIYTLYQFFKFTMLG